MFLGTVTGLCCAGPCVSRIAKRCNFRISHVQGVSSSRPIQKVLSSWGVNCKLQLPKTWRLHPVFHNSLLSPYHETSVHGPNFTKPPPEIIDGEEDHYEVETILQSRLTPNHKGVQYLVKWKGYPSSENSWLPSSQMKHASRMVNQFHTKHPCAPRPLGIKLLTA